MNTDHNNHPADHEFGIALSWLATVSISIASWAGLA